MNSYILSYNSSKKYDFKIKMLQKIPIFDIKHLEVYSILRSAKHVLKLNSDHVL